MSGLTPILRGGGVKGRPRRHRARKPSHAPVLAIITRHLRSVPRDVRRDTVAYLSSEVARLNRRRDRQ